MHPTTRSIKGNRVPVTPNQVSTYDHSGTLYPQRKVYGVGSLAFNNKSFPNFTDSRPSSRSNLSNPGTQQNVLPQSHATGIVPNEQTTDEKTGCLPGDRVVFAESPSAPGVPIVYRLPEEKSANPDRLNLDRRRLTICPILEGEENLRLLNFQHNSIARIQHLSSLRRLIFLDLYDNRIEEISGLSTLSSLRVLMLGKNRISKIDNLNNLLKLDVLDLHGNQIKELENLNHLSELRVLNLAGNQLTKACNFLGLSSLTELNLRRNKIQYVGELDHLPKLLRLFLSYNDVRSFESIRCLGGSQSLQELALDGNPFTAEASYKQIVIDQMQCLRQLDLKKVTDDERRMASIVVRKEQEKKKECSKAQAMKERRRVAIQNAEKRWQEDNNINTGVTPSLNNGNPDNHTVSLGFESLSHYTEVETDTLRLYGAAALDGLDKNNTVSNVAAISHIYFKFIPYDSIVPHFPKLRVRFPALQGLTFSFSSISSLKQLSSLTAVRRLDFISLSPEGNPVTNFSLWKYYLLYRLSHFNLRKINEVDVSMTDTVLAEQLFSELGNVTLQQFDLSRILGLLPDVRRKQVLGHCDTLEQKKNISQRQTEDRRKLIIAAEQKNRPIGTESLNVSALVYNTVTRPKSAKPSDKVTIATSQILDEIVASAISRQNKLTALEKVWNSVLRDTVRAAANDFTCLLSTVDKSLSQIQDT